MPEAGTGSRAFRQEMSDMGKISRFGVSIDSSLLQIFDNLCASRGYTNRSEALRDLIRSAFIEDNWDEHSLVYGVLILVYDHHRNDLSRKLVNIQHEFYDCIVTSMHFHMDHENCLEILMLKGEPENLRQISQKLISATGVKYGVFNPVPQGNEFD